MAKRVKLTGAYLTVYAPDVFGTDPDVASVKFCIEDALRHKIDAATGSIEAARDDIHNKTKLRHTLATLVSNPASIFTVKRVDDIFAVEVKWTRAAARVPMWSRDCDGSNAKKRRAAIDAAEMKEYKRQLKEGL